ncbi:MAG: alpha/beta hydrolase-fold protein [Candidatus Acidiferrales bacterium]
MRSRILRNERDILVYLPPGYDDQPGRHFPVLYMQDGQNLFDPNTSFIKDMYWRVGETADALIGAGAIQPLIIVGIYNLGKRRAGEYTPVKMPRLGGGRAEKYTKMLLQELKPWVESKYRVQSGAAHTGMAGSSLGGLYTLYAGLRFPNVFGKLAALSPSVWWGHGWMNDFAAKAPMDSRPRIWLDVGTREGARIVPTVERFRDVLLGRGWHLNDDLHFEIIGGGEHNEDAWAKRVGPFLQFLFPARATAI